MRFLADPCFAKYARLLRDREPRLSKSFLWLPGRFASQGARAATAPGATCPTPNAPNVGTVRGRFVMRRWFERLRMVTTCA